ncbi:hypothetical protein C1H46_005517 [Malus baccata]|uniref:O-fucosyltransferase family protein n=1 Tax=Malus baccata TaxID=106549 RepID=A0A540NE76_MALBA|nr:hypothetical protein C1H46_005517 [Malus baccata]
MGTKAKAHHHQYNANGAGGGGGNGSESSNSTSPSPPPSPRRHFTVPHCRRKLRTKTISVVSGFLLLRRFLRLLVVLPLLYVSGLLICVGPFSGLVGHTPLPGSVYRSHEMFQLLWPHILADNSTPIEDMVAFSCCLYDGGEAENVAMNSIRQKGWGDKFKRKGRVTLPGLNRIDGKCPLTPLEVGMMLRGMGFDNSTLIYLASGKIYWAEKHLAPLLKMFPYLHTKKSLATPDELAPFEDMVAFSCCLYDGGEAENVAMNSIRQKGWGDKFKRKGRVTLPGLNRIDGKCPLTPLEVGMMLRGMGFDNSTLIYLASGKIYWAEKHLAPLLKMFPYLHTKKSLATPDELAPFEGYSSRLAALDYTVCLFSEIFVTTQGGNFPHFLMGHRRFLYNGHAKTIIPDKRKLVVLLQDMSMSWNDFKLEMEAILTESDRKGKIVPRVKKFTRKSSVYTYPLPECSCLQKHNNTQIVQSTHS